MPMRIPWALLDIATIIVLGSGLYLWFKRRQPRSLSDEAGVRLPLQSPARGVAP